MKFYEGSQERPNLNKLAKVCLCHKDYNHCIANNENGNIPEIFPTEDLAQINFTKSFVEGTPSLRTTTTTTTQAPEIVQAMGFTDLKDEIAISTQAQQNLMFTVGEKNITEKINLSQQKDELILKCSFNQKDCDIESDFLLHYDPTYGNCFTFNWNRTKPLGAHRAGANYGKITIHDKWISPFPDAFGYSAPTGFMSSFGVRMKQFYRISPPHGHCLDGGEDSEFYIYKGFNYNVEGCHRSCTQHEVIRACKCADPMYPIPKDAKPCSVNDPKARDCIKNTTQYLGSLIAEARWPSGTTKLMECEPNDDLCMEKYRKNAAMIQVFYEELNYETLTESPAYTWMMVLADLGGLTGLWIGASVVSTLELVMLAVYTFQAYKKRRKESSVTAYSIRPTLLKQKSTTLSNPSINHRRKTSSLDSKPSLIEKIEAPLVPQLVIESDEDSDSQSERYLPPGAELPCECLYGADGRIVRMKPLCPEHGYLVRRGDQLLPDEEEGAYDDSEGYTSVEIEQEA
uniref:Uncharacterized protein n=1 Tax=Acrobeloides nanus TaxID=290746 RepID=A0A914C4J5_9BILA